MEAESSLIWFEIKRLWIKDAHYTIPICNDNIRDPGMPRKNLDKHWM